MEIIKKFIDWWKSLEFEIQDGATKYGMEKRDVDHRSWCPYCGYSGTADDIRCHLLNDHRSK